MTNGFRFCAKRVFLTYPQCGELNHERVLQFLRDERGATWYTVGLEQHADGGNHVHAYCEFPQRVETRDPRHFDVDGHHPNVQGVRRARDCIRYCQKDGVYIGNVEALGRTRVSYGDIVAVSEGKDEFLQRVVEEYPRDAALHYAQLEYFAEQHYNRSRVEYVPRYMDFIVPANLERWMESNLKVLIYVPWVGTPTGSPPGGAARLNLT